MNAEVTTGRPPLRPVRQILPWSTRAVDDRVLVYGLVAIFTLASWIVIAALTSPWFFPSPLETARAIVALTVSGDLPRAIGISYFRILAGWACGCAVAIPLALVAGRVRLLRLFVEPYVNF